MKKLKDVKTELELIQFYNELITKEYPHQYYYFWSDDYFENCTEALGDLEAGIGGKNVFKFKVADVGTGVGVVEALELMDLGSYSIYKAEANKIKEEKAKDRVLLKERWRKNGINGRMHGETNTEFKRRVIEAGRLELAKKGVEIEKDTNMIDDNLIGSLDDLLNS